jgi:PTH1 family peptidyl-tRNA hydrolase
LPIRLLVGLGNPGARYERNRHNIGFMAVDALVRRHGFGAFRSKFQSAIGEGTIAGERVYVQKPQTYMNLSGDAVGEAARFYKVAPDEIAVIHDEIDLAPGKLKVKRGGGSAGHNGLRSIDDAIGEDFWRVRLGVGHPGVKELVHAYVLQNFDAEEMVWVTPLIDAIAEALPQLIKDDAPGFMTKVALILKPPPPKPPRAAVEKED